jgi:hypothetical protein
MEDRAILMLDISKNIFLKTLFSRFQQMLPVLIKFRKETFFVYFKFFLNVVLKIRPYIRYPAFQISRISGWLDIRPNQYPVYPLLIVRPGLGDCEQVFWRRVGGSHIPITWPGSFRWVTPNFLMFLRRK